MFEFKLPDLGEGVAEGEILKWYVEVGGEIGEDEPLVDVETDKAAVTIPSPKSGTLASVAGGVGDTVDVGSVLCTIDAGASGGATASAPAAAAPAPAPETPAAAASAPASPPPSSTPTPSRAPAPQAAPVAVAPAAVRANGGPVPAAPATRRIARELGLDINTVPGSGPGGRITAEDVRLFAEGGIAVATAGLDVGFSEFTPGSAPSGIPYYELEPSPDFESLGPVEREPVRSIRRKVARKMVTSMVTVPHVSHMDDADVTELEAYRKRLKADGGPSLTLMAFVIKALTVSLKQFRSFNASIDPERNELVYKGYYNVGFAADTPQGLMVPVIRGSDQMSVIGISDEIRRLAAEARDRTIDVSGLTGGTFTVTNVGAIGGKYVAPTINYPESAILGMGRTADEAVVRNGEVVVRKILPLCLTYDHRISDGADGARFMNALVRHLSDPLSLLSEIV